MVRLTCASVALATPASALAETRLCAAPDLVAVVDDVDLRVYAGDGRLLRRLAPDEAPSAGASADSRTDGWRERILDLHDVPTELRDSQEAEDLIEEELPVAQRRRSSGWATAAERSPDRALLAAEDGAGGLWLAWRGRLHRMGPGINAVPVGPLPGSPRALAADDAGTIVVLDRSRLLVSADGGRSFRVLVALDREASHLALDPGGRWVAWADAAGVHVLRGSGRQLVPLDQGARDLRSCDGHLVLLTDLGLHVGAAGGAPVRVSGPLPARQIACPRAGPGPWLAAGAGLFESRDHGRSFRSRLDAPPGRVLAAALTRNRIWLATPAGIRTLPSEPPPSGASPPLPAGDSDGEAEGVYRPMPGWATWLLPRLSLAASYAETERRRDWRALALAELPLDGPDRRPRTTPDFARRLTLAQPTAAEPPSVPATEAPLSGAAPTPSPPPPHSPPGPAASPPYPTHPTYPARPSYPPPDPDAGCLAQVRARAVARAQAEAERARSLVGRAGSAPWLPELRLLAEKRMGRSESLDLRGGATTPARDAHGLDATNAVRYEVRAIWDLPRLVFNPEEVAAVQQALRMADMRREIEAQVNRVYFERRRLLVNPAGQPAVEDTGALLRVEELAAELDAVSAGEFSRCLGVESARHGP